MISFSIKDFIAGGITTGGLVIILFIYFLKHPEKFQKWMSMIAWFISTVWKKAEYRAIKWEVQGKINSFVGNLEAHTSAQFPRVVLDLVGRNEEDVIWEDGEAIIVVRDRKHKNKNFVHAAYLFTSKALLRTSKRHLSKQQKTSIDLFATQKLLRDESAAAVEQFVDDYLAPVIAKNDDVRVLIKQFTDIDRIGAFFPVLIQELHFLGNKVFLDKPTQDIIQDVKLFIGFLEEFSHRNVGENTNDEFIGKYLRCAVKVVARKEVRSKGDITGHKDRISNVIKRGFENIYLVGDAGEENIDFIKRVSTSILEDHPSVQLIKSYQVDGQIKLEGKPAKVKTHLTCLHNPDSVKHMYTTEDLNTVDTEKTLSPVS